MVCVSGILSKSFNVKFLIEPNTHSSDITCCSFSLSLDTLQSVSLCVKYCICTCHCTTREGVEYLYKLLEILCVVWAYGTILEVKFSTELQTFNLNYKPTKGEVESCTVVINQCSVT